MLNERPSTLGTPIVYYKPEVKLLNPEVVKDFFRISGEFAAPCYATDIEKVDPDRIGAHVFEASHMPPMRATHWIFNIKGLSRADSHQLVRNKVGTLYIDDCDLEIAQRSQRYVKELTPSYCVPPTIAASEALTLRHSIAMTEAWKNYAALLSAGVPAEVARGVLPNDCATELNMGFSPQAFFHSCEERLCTRAQWAIREAFLQMRSLIIEVEPRVAERCVAKCEYLGWCPEMKTCGRKPKKKDALK